MLPHLSARLAHRHAIRSVHCRRACFSPVSYSLRCVLGSFFRIRRMIEYLCLVCCALYCDSRTLPVRVLTLLSSTSCYKEPPLRRPQSSHSTLCIPSTTVASTATSTHSHTTPGFLPATMSGDSYRMSCSSWPPSRAHRSTVDYRMQLNNYLQANGGARLLTWEVYQSGPLHQPLWTAIAYSG